MQILVIIGSDSSGNSHETVIIELDLAFVSILETIGRLNAFEFCVTTNEIKEMTMKLFRMVFFIK